MKPRFNHLLLLPAGAGLVLGTALAWALGLARPVPGRAMELRPPNPLRAIIADQQSPSQTEPESRLSDVRGHHPIWVAAGLGRPGLFDQRRADRAPGPEAPRIRRREVALVATRDLPYRLQLIGHFGEGGNLSGIFEAEGAGGPWIARGGEELPELGLMVRALELAPASGEVPARLQARIWDRRTEREVLLPESVRVPSGIASALLAPAGYPGEAIELLAGEVVAVGDSEFRVERIGLAPASATLRRLAVVVPDDGDDELFLQIEDDPES